jgi:biotin synthase-like enzyme
MNVPNPISDNHKKSRKVKKSQEKIKEKEENREQQSRAENGKYEQDNYPLADPTRHRHHSLKYSVFLCRIISSKRVCVSVACPP